MKKTKLFMATALLFAASTLFIIGCQPEAENPDSTPIQKPDPKPNPDPDPKPVEEITLDLSAYSYRKNFVSTSETLGITISDWGDGTDRKPNEDGSWTLTASTSMWGGISGVVAPFTGLNAGLISQYDYIAFTGDFSNFTINDTEDPEVGNAGVNIKVPDVQKRFATKNKNADGTITYYIATSEFGEAPKSAVEFAIIIGGSGSIKLTEVYLAAKENPVKPVSAITIAPETTTIASENTVTFTVKDSNFNDVTANTTFAIDGEDATGSTIAANVLTAGKTAGTVTVKATYTCDDGTFTATASIEVTAALTNLVTKVGLERVYLGPGWNALLQDVTELAAAAEYLTIENNVATYKLPAGLGEQWQAQLKLSTDADIKKDEKWYFSFKLSGLNGNFTLKLNDNEILVPMFNKVAFTDGQVITCSGTSPEDIENISLMFDFGTCPEGTVVISDIMFAKTN